MSFKASSGHQDRFIIKTEICIPGNSAVENDPVMKGNIRSQNSITGNEEQKYCHFCIRGRKDQFEKTDDFCFDKRHCQIFCKSK